MENLIIIAVILLIIGGASAYIIKAKKKGVKCIGCPAASQCAQGDTHQKGNSCSVNCGTGSSPCSGCSGCSHKN